MNAGFELLSIRGTDKFPPGKELLVLLKNHQIE